MQELENLHAYLQGPEEQLQQVPGGEARAALDIVSRLAIACKSRLLYHAEHPAVKEAVSILHHVIRDSLGNLPELAVRVEKDDLVFGDQSLVGERESLRQLASRIRSRHIRAIIFSPQVGPHEAAALVEILSCPPETLEKEGGAEAYLLSRGIHGIRIVESEAQRAEDREAPPPEEGGVFPEDQDEKTALLVSEEDLEEFVEMIFDPETLAEVLSRLTDEEDRPLQGEELAKAIYAFLQFARRKILEVLPERKHALARCFAETILFLERNLRNLLLRDHLLPGIGKDPLCREVMGSFSRQETAAVLSFFLPLAPELIPRVDALLESFGLGDEEVTQAVQLIRDRLIDLGEVSLPLLSSLDAILIKRGAGEAGPGLPTLSEVSLLSSTFQVQEMEEIRGISEMDLTLETYQESTPMLLDLLEKGSELDNLGKVIDLLTENFWGLVTTARFDTAAAILESFHRALYKGDPAFVPHREEMNRLLEEAANKNLLQRSIRLASEKRRDKNVVAGFKMFMRKMGDRGVLALIEALGSEESMSVRKFIIDILAELGREKIPLLGSFLDDKRWFLVRNIATVMSRLRSPATLPYLERALEYPHPKVRSEAVRAVGLTGGFESIDLLLKGMNNSDERTRILCIRWLGRLQVAGAVPRLVDMLEGKQPGAESLEVKKEILESLGRIGDPSTYELLKKYAGRQRLFFKSDWQELSIAAQKALQNLQESSPKLSGKRKRTWP